MGMKVGPGVIISKADQATIRMPQAINRRRRRNTIDTLPIKFKSLKITSTMSEDILMIKKGWNLVRSYRWIANKSSFGFKIDEPN
ncbi:hypothetical protein CsSME_00029132 [Camellia sinensis var. sinensis]